LTRRIRLEGIIVASGFASGDRIVAGVWNSGPLGPMVDVMWARPDGTRVLLAPNRPVAEFVGGIYAFDRTEIVELDARRSRDRLNVTAGEIAFDAWAGKANPLFGLRPKVLRRSLVWVRIEDVIFRAAIGRLMLGGARGVRAYGRTPSGVREWYCVDSYRPLLAARASCDGVDLGPMAPVDPPVGFGVSEFPHRPALVECAPVLEGPLPL
jgi:hypothetical protein